MTGAARTAGAGDRGRALVHHGMMAEPERRRARYEDLYDIPEHHIGEIIAGELYTQPRPGVPHARASSVLGAVLYDPFDSGGGGPGGWVVLDEPELHLGADVLVPDLAGWRRERMPELPRDAALTLAPDWVCEVLSPRTRAHDRVRKMPVYAREGVGHLWLVDPDAKLLEIYRLDGESYRSVGSHDGDARVRAEPFDAIELELGALWR